MRALQLIAFGKEAEFRERFDPDSWLHDESGAWMVIDAFQITGRVLHGARDWELGGAPQP